MPHHIAATYPRTAVVADLPPTAPPLSDRLSRTLPAPPENPLSRPEPIPQMNQHAPEFAMSFTQEAVLLERRDGRDWRPLGQARFSADMASTLAALRDSAGLEDQAQADTVLIIPDDQILYVTLTLPPGSDPATAIGRALANMTPYAAEELAYDWCPDEGGDPDSLRVATVARRTLDEAEEFALAQGFRPSGFAARPGDDRFLGQPDFGPTRLAGEQRARRPFSSTDLAQINVTGAMIAEPSDPVPGNAADAPVVSRIVPHHIAPVAGAGGAAVPGTPPIAEARAPVDGAAAAGGSAPAVIRHGDRALTADRPLSPRAKAVHSRAAEARARRLAGAAGATDAARQSGRAGGWRPGPLAQLVGGLLLALLLAWVFLGSGDGPMTAGDPAITPPGNDSRMADPTAPGGPADPTPEETGALAELDGVAGDVPTDAQLDGAQTDLSGAPTEAAARHATARDPGAPEPATTQAADQPAPASPLSPASLPAPAAPDAATRAAVDTVTADGPAPALGSDAGREANDALTAALSEAMAGIPAAPVPAAPVPAASGPDASEADPSAAAESDIAPPAAPAPSPATRDQAGGTPPATPVAAAPAPRSAPGLARSARPRTAPERTVPTRTAAPAAPAAPDPRPDVPDNPQPYAERATAEAPTAGRSRPPERPSLRRSAPPAATPAATPAAAATPAPAPAAASSGRPPSRPERVGLLEQGDAPDMAGDARLTEAERQHLLALLRDLRTAEAGRVGLSPAERDVLIRLADARPTRRPGGVTQSSNDAIREAVSQASAAPSAPRGNGSLAPRPSPRASTAAPALAPSAAPPASTATRAQPGGTVGRLAASGRPQSRPGSRGGASDAAVQQAIAAAVADSPARPGSVPLTALTSSTVPPRRVGAPAAGAAAAGAGAAAAATAPTGAITGAATPMAALAPSADALRSAATNQAAEAAAMAEQRRIDAELQAQAEARARARASADAAAEAQARAAAEARARAQAEAEARSAANRNQRYTPPEAENEPEAAAPAQPDGRTPANVATAATVTDGIQLRSTQIIGTIGAGKASRALVRLSNGRVITLRLGDRINGGTITAIGDSRITYVKGGRQLALGVLNGQ